MRLLFFALFLTSAALARPTPEAVLVPLLVTSSVQTWNEMGNTPHGAIPPASTFEVLVATHGCERREEEFQVEVVIHDDRQIVKLWQKKPGPCKPTTQLEQKLTITSAPVGIEDVTQKPLIFENPLLIQTVPSLPEAPQSYPAPDPKQITKLEPLHVTHIDRAHGAIAISAQVMSKGCTVGEDFAAATADFSTYRMLAIVRLQDDHCGREVPELDGIELRAKIPDDDKPLVLANPAYTISWTFR